MLKLKHLLLDCPPGCLLYYSRTAFIIVLGEVVVYGSLQGWDMGCLFCVSALILWVLRTGELIFSSWFQQWSEQHLFWDMLKQQEHLIKRILDRELSHAACSGFWVKRNKLKYHSITISNPWGKRWFLCTFIPLYTCFLKDNSTMKHIKHVCIKTFLVS